MNIKKFFRSKKFLNRIYILVTAVFLILLSVFSSFAYYNTEKIVLENEYKTNRNILEQVKYNISFIDETVKNIWKNLYINTDVVSIMNNNDNDMDIVDVVTMLRRIDTMLVTNPVIDTIYIYNNTNRTFYSYSAGIFQNDNIFKELIRTNGSIPLLKPVFIKNGFVDVEKQKPRKLFTYFMYESTDKENVPDGALIVNLNLQWLLNNIRQINMVDEKKQSNIFVYNEQGDLIEGTRTDESFIKSLKGFFNEYKKNNFSFSDNRGFITKKIGGEKYILTFLYFENADLILVKTQPYNEVFNFIWKMRVTIIVVTFIFLILVAFVSLSVSMRIYKPIGSLVRQVSSGGLKKVGTDTKDEISYLNEVYRISEDMLNNYETERITNRDILKMFYLKKLLIETSSVLMSEFLDTIKENNISLNMDEGFALCVMKLDNYKDFEKKYDVNDRKLIKFAIINISTEVVSASFKVEGIEMDEDKVVLILNTGCSASWEDQGNTDDEYYRTMIGLAKQSQQFIMQYFQVSVSATISERIKDVIDLTGLYSQTVANSMYRYIFGKMSVITPDMVKVNNENTRLEFTMNFEKKLAQEIKSGNLQDLQDLLQNIIKETTGFSYNNIIISLLQVVNTIKTTIDEINKVNMEAIYCDIASISRKIFELETVDVFYAMVMEQLKLFIDKKDENIINEKHLVIVESIVDLIEKNYYRGSLCLSEIASTLSMSTGYIGRIFKENKQMSVTEYINEVRLKKAAEWLENSHLGVGEILAKIGVENETYFYSLFKKKFGITPKEYALQKKLQRI